MAETRRSLRARITAAAVGVVAAVLVAGALAFYAILDASVRDAVGRAAEVRAEELAARAETEGAAALDGLEDAAAQIVSDDDEVLARSEDAPSSPLPRSGSATVDGEPAIVRSESIGEGRELRLAVAADDDDGALATTALLLSVSVPLGLAVVGALTWVVVGRALRPVARIRADVDAITAEHLDRRLSVPASGDEIAALATTMNRMLDRLDAAATTQRRFVSDASHELRSPLAVIRQHAELAQLHPAATSAAELADVVHTEGLRMQELVDALLLLARLDERAPLRRASVDLDDLVWAEAARLRAHGIDIDVRGVGAAQVTADPALLARVVRNLADNAARHARGRVAFSVATQDGWAQLSVDDDGAGIPPGERERVFERFVRLDEARDRDAGGSGLGLAIVRAVSEAAGGSAVAADGPLGGARFTITLPAAS